MPIDLLRYEFRLAGPGGIQEKVLAEVRPVEYAQKMDLSRDASLRAGW